MSNRPHPAPKLHLGLFNCDKSNQSRSSALSFSRDLRAAKAALESNAVEQSESPYCDNTAAAADLASRVFNGRGSLLDRAFKICSMFKTREGTFLSGPRMFRMDPSHELLDDLPNAGEIMTNPMRKVVLDGQPLSMFTHIMDPIIVIISAMRQNGLPCYPVLASVNGQSHDEGDRTLAIAILNESSLAILSPFGVNINVAGAEVLSDRAMLSTSHAMMAARAANRAALKTSAMIRDHGRTMDVEEFATHAKSIADQLFLSKKIWPENPFISETFSFLYKRFFSEVTLASRHKLTDLVSSFSNVGLELDPEAHKSKIDRGATLHSNSAVGLVSQILEKRMRRYEAAVNDPNIQ